MQSTRIHLFSALLVLGLWGSPALTFAQGNTAQTTSPKPFTIREALANPALQVKMPRQVQWCSTSDWFSYVKAGGTAPDTLYRQNAKTRAIERVMTADQWDRTGKRMPAITWASPTQVRVQLRNQVLAYDLGTKAVTTVVKWDDKGEDVDVNPATGAVAYTKGSGLYIQKGGQTLTVAEDNTHGIVLGKTVHRSEFGIHNGTFWSEKGNRLAFYRMDVSMVTEYPLVDLGAAPAKPNQIRYPMAGQTSHHVTVGVYDLKTGKTIYLKTGEPAEQYLTNVAISPDERFVYIAIVNRDQNHMRLVQFDAVTGEPVRTLFEEKHAKYVEPENPPLFVPDGSGNFVWQSERDGYNHLYLYTPEGKLLAQLTKGTNPVVEATFANAKTLVYTLATSNGLERQSNALTLGSKSSRPITTEAGTHIASVNAAATHVLDSYTSLSTPGQLLLREVNSKTATSLYLADNPLKNYQQGTTELVTLKASDGTPLNGRMIKPRDFDPGRKYPVIVYLYGGPHAQMVTNSWLGGGNLWFHHLAQQGFLVFTMDNRGSSNRGLAFENATFRQLGTVEAEDQLVGVNYLRSLPYVDTARLGIHGWSFGGFMTTTMMTRHPGNFKVGVAGGPVIDWALYEVMYTERYMDTPAQNPEGYQQANLLNHAEKLKGKLLMIHGTDDDVVVWQHSQKFLKECVDEGIHLDYFVYPGHKHNVVGKDRIHLLEKITRYFKENL